MTAEKRETPTSLDGIQHGGNHYKGMAIQPAEYNTANGLGFAEGSVVKYITRHKVKGKAEDVKKAIHFCQMILDMQYGVKVEVRYPNDGDSQ